MNESWRGEFEAFDEDWSHRARKRLASADGVRATYYAAGYRAGSNAIDALRGENDRLKAALALYMRDE